MKTIIIGAGFAGLAAACYMARAGHRVQVLEQLPDVGGRARRLVRDGFCFDMGPSFYWMPDVFERFFADFGKRPEDFYSLRRLDPGYEIRFGPGDRIREPADPDELTALFERIEPGSGRFLCKFLRGAAADYRVAAERAMYLPGRSPLELVMRATVARLPEFFVSVSDVVRRSIHDDRLRRMLEFPSLFLGAKPSDTPSFYRFMNYADMVLGTWYPEGGMYRVAQGIARLAESLGAEVLTGRKVRGFETAGDRVRAVLTDEGRYEADVVISGADYRHTESLLPAGLRNYPEGYWQRRVMAPSALLYFIGFGKRIGHVAHHTLFFDTSFDVHAARIYDRPGWPSKPLFYASFPSVSDRTICPEGAEAAVVLIPVAAGLEDTPAIRARYFDEVLQRMERLTGRPLRGSVLFHESYAATDFMRDYNAYRGNAYGLANTLTQTAFMRPKIRSRSLRNLFFTGQLTVPGPGVPPALASGKVAAACALKAVGGERKKNFEYDG